VIIADTHAWVWWHASPKKLSARARAALGTSSEIGLCAISCWEIATLVARKRLSFDRDVLLWLKQSLSTSQARLVPLDPDIAVACSQLKWNHSDSADRLIVASAVIHRAQIVTKDERIRSFRQVQSIW